MQSETLAQEFARLVKEYHEGDDHTKPEAWNLLADYAVDNADAISAALSKPVANSTCGRRIERETNDGDAKNASSARDIYDPVGVEAHAENERSDDYGLRQPAHSDRSRREGTPLAALSDQERAVEVKIKPLEWEDIGSGFSRARAPLFGNIRVEKYGDLFTTCYSVPGYSNVFAEGAFASAKEAKAACNAKYQECILSALVDVPVEPVKPDWWQDEEAAEREFTEYFVRNYPGPDTIIYDPKWHAPKLFRAAKHALLATKASPPHREGEDSAEVDRLTRPIVGIENRTAQEVFDIMADRIRLAATRSASATSTSGTSPICQRGESE